MSSVLPRGRGQRRVFEQPERAPLGLIATAQGLQYEGGGWTSLCGEPEKVRKLRRSSSWCFLLLWQRDWEGCIPLQEGASEPISGEGLEANNGGDRSSTSESCCALQNSLQKSKLWLGFHSPYLLAHVSRACSSTFLLLFWGACRYTLGMTSSPLQVIQQKWHLCQVWVAVSSILGSSQKWQAAFRNHGLLLKPVCCLKRDK